MPPSTLLPRALTLRAYASTTEVRDLADLLVDVIQEMAGAELKQAIAPTVRVTSGVDCLQCGGSGSEGPDRFCSRCNGDGVEWWIEDATLKAPKS